MDDLNSSVTDLYGDIDVMFVSQSSAVPQTETDTSMCTSTSLDQSSSTCVPSDKNFSDDAGTGVDEDIYDDDFNLYDETIGEKQQQITDSHDELKKQCELLMSKLEHLETENKSLHMKYDKTEQENLEAKRNIARLLLTTKGEICRKDKEIANLRMRLSASPRGRRNNATRGGAPIGSSSFSSIDSDFNPLCVSSPGNNKLKRSSYAKFQSYQENTLSSLSNIENTDTAGSRSPHQGRNKTEEISRNSGGLAKCDKINEKSSRSSKDCDNVSRDNSKLKTMRSVDNRKEKVKSHNVKDSKISEKSDSSHRSTRSSKLEDERRNGKSVAENYQKADTKSLFKSDKTEKSHYCSDIEVDVSSDNEKKNRIVVSDKIDRTKLNDKSEVEGVDSTDSREKCDDSSSMHAHIKRRDTEENLAVDISSKKTIERSVDVNKKNVISKENDSVESNTKTICGHESVAKQIKSSIKRSEKHKSGDTGIIVTERRPTERERNKRIDERRKMTDKDRAKSGDKRTTEDERRMNERVRHNSTDKGNRRCATVVTECEGTSESSTKPKVLDLREKLRQKRLKSESINNGNSAQNACRPNRDQTKAIHNQNIKKSITVAEEICDASSSYEIDFLEYSNNEICEIWDTGENKETKEKKSMCDKNSMKEEIVSKRKDESSVIKLKTNKDADKPKKCLNEDLEFLNKLKTSIQKKSVPSSSNSENVHCSFSKSVSTSETLEKSNVPSRCVKELGDTVRVSSENNVNISETISESFTDEGNKIKTSHHEKIESDKIDVTMNREENPRKDNETCLENDNITNAKSNNADSTSDVQSVHNEDKNDEHVSRERETINPKLSNEHSLRNPPDSDVPSSSKTHSAQDIIALPNETDARKCMSGSDESSLNLDDSASSTGVTSETVSSCTSSKMSKSVMEFFQTIDEKKKSVISKSNSSQVDKMSSCNVKNCSIKMRHLHPKQSNEKSLPLKSDKNMLTCDDEKSENTITVAQEVSSSVLNKSSNNVDLSETPIQSSAFTKSTITNSHQISDSSIKPSMNGNSPLNVPSVQTGNLEKNGSTSGTNETSISKNETEVQQKQCSEMNEPDLLETIRDLQTSSVSVNDICEQGPAIEKEDFGEEGTAENESEGSFGSNIVSEKTESWRSSDDSDSDVSCSTYSGDSSSDESDENSASSVDNTDYTSSSGSDGDDYISDLENNDGEKPAIKSTADTSSVNLTSTTLVDKSVKRSESTLPLNSCVKNSNPRMINRKLTSLDAVIEHENTLSQVASCGESIPRTVWENDVGVKSTSVKIKQNGNKNKVLDLETVNSSADVENEKAIMNEEKKSKNVVSKHVALNEKLAMENADNGSSRSNMLLQLLNCIEKEFTDRKTFSVNQDCHKDSSKNDGDGLEDTRPEVENDVTEPVNIVNKNTEDKTCNEIAVAIVESDHKSKDAGKVVKDISKNNQNIKDDACNVKTNVNNLSQSVNPENTVCEKLFGQPLSESSCYSSGSESDSGSCSSYSSHSSDCSTCSSSYTSGSSSSSDDSEDEDNLTDNLKTVKQTQKNESNQQTQMDLNPSCKIQETSNSKSLSEMDRNEVLDEPSQVLCYSGDRINEASVTTLVEKSDSLETYNHDLPANVSAKNSIKSTKIPSIAKKAVPTECKSGNKLRSQTCKILSTPKSVNRNSNKVTHETRVTRNKSGGSVCSTPMVSPNPYLIVDEIPEFLTSDGNTKSTNCNLLRGSTENISPKNMMASPAAVFISPKKGCANHSQTVYNYSLGVIGSVDNEKDSVSKSISVSLISSASLQSNVSANTSSHSIEKKQHQVDVEHRHMSTTRSRNNSLQSNQSDITEKVTKKPRVAHSEIKSRKASGATHKKDSDVQEKDLENEKSPGSSNEDKVLDGHSQVLFGAKEPSVTGLGLRRSPRKKSSFTNHTSLLTTANSKKTVSNEKNSSKKMYIDSAGALFGKALTENRLVKKKNDCKSTKDKNLFRCEKKPEKGSTLGRKSVNGDNVKSKLNVTVSKQSENVSVNQTKCKNSRKYSDKNNDEQCNDSNVDKQSVKTLSDVPAGSAKNFGGSRKVSTHERGVDKRVTPSKGQVKLNYKSPKEVGKKSITENQPRPLSCTLSSPMKKFTIPKLKRKANLSPEEDKDKKFLEKRRKPLQTMSPVKSTPSICLKRTSDGKWSKTQSQTVRVSEINFSSSSDESSEDSSIVNALFGRSTDDKVVETPDTKRHSEEGMKRKVNDSGSTADIVEKDAERSSKNKKSDHLSKCKNTKSVPSEPFLFLDEHTMDRTDYEDVLCLDNCDDDFNDDISNDGLEDGEVSSASEPENKFQNIKPVAKNKSCEAKNIDSLKDVSNDSKDVCKDSKDKHSKSEKNASNIKKLTVDDEVSRRYKRRNTERKSPRYKNRGRSRSPKDSGRRSQSSYDRDRKYSKDSYFSPGDRRIRSYNKRRRSRSNSRHRDSDSYRSKRRNTSLHS